MRLKFIKGKQKELIKKFRKEKSLTWNQLADFLDIKFGKLKAYVDETSLIDEKIYLNLDNLKEYRKYSTPQKFLGFFNK